MRLIDADELMATLSHNCYPVQHDMTSIEPGMTLMGMLQAIQEQPTIEPQRWIPCSERLPENDDKVLCCTVTTKGVRNIVIGYYMERWCCGMNSNVIAWQPLPEPYKGAET